MMSRVLSIGCLVAAGQLLAPVASAHIELLEPPSRYGRQENKSCPCGVGQSNQTCNVARDGSDPNRSETVSTFEAGSTITLRVNEYFDHGGRFRVAFDEDGADHDDFNAQILLDVPDPQGVTSNTDEPGVWEFEVALPDLECENCTLQVIQVMHGDTENPVPDPAALSTYYSCADLRLVRAGGGEGSTGAGVGTGSTGGDGVDDTTGGSGPVPSSTTSGVTPPGDTGDGHHHGSGDGHVDPPAPGGTTGTGPVGTGGGAPSPSESAGGCTVSPETPHRGAWTLVLLGLLGFRAKRGRALLRPRRLGA